MARGKAFRLLKFDEAAVLDWCWRNCSYRGIRQETVDASIAAIRDDYHLGPSFDEKSLAGSLQALERNGSIISKPNGTWHLAEEVNIFG